MIREPVFNIRLSQLDKVLLDSSPFFRIDVLRVVMAFRTLDHDTLSSLAEYADAQGGRIERWLMVPSSMPLSVLAYVIDRAFGLVPSPDTSSFLLPEDRFRAYAPDMASFLKRSGRLFFNPIQDDYLDAVASESALRRTFIMDPPYDLPHLSYEACQEILEGYISHFPSEGIMIGGRRCAMDDIEPTEEALLAVTHAVGEPFVRDISPYIPFPYILGREGASLASASEADKALSRKSFDIRSRGARPLTHELIYEHLSYEQPDDGFRFSITRPKDVRSIIEDGYLDLEAYIDSARYVSSTLMPDCIAKIGYDLFGETEHEYASFIMRLHSPDAQAYRAYAEEAGWREPYIDKRKVLR